jgi:two-component system sensor histidine kinase DesK
MNGWLAARPDSLLGQLDSSPHLRRQAWLSQLWLVALFIVPLSDHMAVATWLLPTLLSVPVYLYLHAQVFIGPYRRLLWLAVGMLLLGLLLWPFNSVGFGYIVSAGSMLALLPSWRRWLAVVLLMTLPVTAMSLWLQVSPIVMLAIFSASLLTGLGHRLQVRNIRRDAELRLSQIEVRRLATLAERERIGRDLHDLLGHTLSLVALKSELARKLALRDPAAAQREMEEVERVSRHALVEVRAAVTGMRRSDLAAELVSARLMLEASGVSFSAELPEGFALPPAIEAPLALVLREAITNIHRHAHASEASVRFSIEATGLRMQIGDNGCGGLSTHGNGVSGMRERVRELGGTLEIDSPARRGTRISIRVPLGASAATERVPSSHARSAA